jgi:hypothetical protein
VDTKLYRKPKIKIKNVDTSKTVVKGKSSDEYPSFDETGGQVKMAPVADKIRLVRPEGKTTYRKASGPAEPNIIDERANTNEMAKEAIRKMRLKNEMKLKKSIEGM